MSTQASGDDDLKGTKRLRDDEEDGKEDAAVVRIKTEVRGKEDTNVVANDKEKEAPKASSSWYHPQVPNTAHYHVSWMHANTVTHVAHCPSLGVILTASRDGVVKFWKRLSVVSSTAAASASEPVEFVKAITAHAAPVVSLCVATTTTLAASVDQAGHVQFYDIALFDAAARMHLGQPQQQYRWAPRQATWVTSTVDRAQVLVVAAVSGPLQVVSPESSTVLQTLWMHGQDTTVTAMVFNPVHQCVLSGDQRGMLQMWDTHGDYVVVAPTTAEGATTTTTTAEGSGDDTADNNQEANTATTVHIGATVTARRNSVTFTSRLDTHLLHLHQKQTHAVSMAVTPSGSHYAVYGADLRVRLFVHETGHLLCTYDERLKVYDEQHNMKPYHLDAMEYGRRAALERDLTAPSKMPSMQLQFESTEGKYLLVPTLMGLKVIDWKRHKLVKLVGAADAAQQRFVGLCQCAGPAVIDAQLQLARQQEQKEAAPAQLAQSEKEDAAAAAEGITNKVTDALLIAWAYQSRRFFVFSHIDPTISDDDKDDQDALVRRDHWNEQPDATDTAAAALASTTTKTTTRLASQAVIHTTMGDIHVQLFGTQAPKTIENFGTHARNGYYDGLLFHRIIKGFMLQTGDPKGDGTGGEVSVPIASMDGVFPNGAAILTILMLALISFVYRAYGEVNLPTKLCLACATTDLLPFPWRMQGQTPTDHSSLSQQFPARGWMANIPCLVASSEAWMFAP